MKKPLLQIVNEVLARKGGPELESISDLMDLRNDLGMDSLDLAFLTVLIESEYRVDVFKTGLVYKISEIREKINI